MAVLERFFGSGNDLDLPRMPSTLRDSISVWLRRAQEDRGPVAFLPRSVESRLWWYGLTQDSRSRRELLDILDAWIGPAFSDLQRSRGLLDRADPFDAALLSECGERWLRFEVLPRSSPERNDARRRVRRTLLDLDNLLSARPPSVVATPRATSEVLEDIGHAIATGDGDLAQSLLEELRNAGDLDEVNLAYQRFRVLGGLNRWERVLKDDALSDVLELRRPPGVERVIERAFYETYLRVLDEAERDADLVEAFGEGIANYPGLGLRAPAPASRGEAVLQTLVARNAPEETRMSWLERLIGRADEVELGLTARLRRLVSHDAEAEAATKEPLQEAQERLWSGDSIGVLQILESTPPSGVGARLAVMAAADLGTAEAARRALELVHSSEAREDIVAFAPSRLALEAVEKLVSPDSPSSWQEWFDRLSASDVDSSRAVTWVREADDWGLLDAGTLKRAVLELDLDDLALLGDVAGSLLGDHSRVLSSADLGDIAEQLLLGLAMSGRTSAGVRAQVLTLLDVFLSAGPGHDQVSSVVDAVGEMRDAMASSGTVDWLIDMVHVLADHPLSDAAGSTRSTFVFETLDVLRRFRTSLDHATLESLASACEALDLSLPSDLDALRTEAAEDESLGFDCLSGQRVVIYSLMESSARRAAATLRRLVDFVDVEVTADHVGSSRLADLSRGADVFVLVTAAAKHAATDFIQEHRSGTPPILVNSKGTSAILRELRGLCD